MRLSFSVTLLFPWRRDIISAGPAGRDFESEIGTQVMGTLKTQNPFVELVGDWSLPAVLWRNSPSNDTYQVALWASRDASWKGVGLDGDSLTHFSWGSTSKRPFSLCFGSNLRKLLVRLVDMKRCWGPFVLLAFAYFEVVLGEWLWNSFL